MGTKSVYVFTLLLAPVLVAGALGADPLWQSDDADGLISVEAENFDRNTPQGGHEWQLVGPTGGFTGAAGMQSLPNSNTNRNANYLTQAPRLDYEAVFIKTGTHYVWVRGWGAGGSDDSFHFGIDNRAIDTCDRMDGINNAYTWTSSTMDTDPSLFQVDTPGRHTLNLWMREDGAIIDKVVITSNPAYRPAGNGPAESVRAPLVKAYAPEPANGATNITMSLLRWSKGDTAVTHDVYLGTTRELTETDRVAAGQSALSPFYYHFPGLQAGTTYYWRVDQFDIAGTPYVGDVWTFSTPPAAAWAPSPPDGVVAVLPNVVLTWTAGMNATLHDIYFGTSEADVSAGAAGVRIAVDRPLTEATPGPLAEGTTYYWRVDETLQGGGKVTGNVWSFTTLPKLAIDDPALVAWFKLDEGMATAIDWSGNGHHGTLKGGSQWVEGYAGGALQFDGTTGYVDVGPVGISGAAARTIAGWAKANTTAVVAWTDLFGLVGPSSGTRDGKFFDIECVGNTTDTTLGYYGLHIYGWQRDILPIDLEWHHLAATHDGTTAAWYGDGKLIGSIAVDVNTTDYVHMGKRSDNSNFFAGVVDDVRIYTEALTAEEIVQVMRADTLRAWGPNPPTGAVTDALKTPALTWEPGDTAVQHDVYLGTDPNAVRDANTADATGVYRGRQAGTSFTPDPALEWRREHFWRIDEVDGDGAIIRGSVWRFTLTDSLIIDDFEAYTNDVEAQTTLYDTWIDGVVNGNGSQVGSWDPPFAERLVIHGGRQSMPITYDNTAQFQYSEVTRTFAPAQDWTTGAVTTLLLYFHGEATNSGQLYLKINSAKVAYSGDAGDLSKPGWTRWTVDLASVVTNLRKVTSLTIGIDGGGKGKVIIDDIVLVREAPAPVEEVWLEAEAANPLGAKWRRYDDPTASAGKHIGSENGDGDDNNAAPGADWVAGYKFTVSAGVYKVLLRVKTDSDSFWVRILGATSQTHEHPDQPGTGWVRFNGILAGAAWHWDEVHSSDHNNAVVSWTLPAGTHTLEIAKREDGTWVDAIVISKVSD